MLKKILIALFVLTLVPLTIYAQTQKPDTGIAVSKGSFDPASDPEKDLAAAVTATSKTGQNILLDVGGEWCIWCRRLDKFFSDNQDIYGFLHKNFVVVKVNYSKENKNEKFLAKYPKVEGYPHIFILDKKGRLLHSQDTGKLESGDHHDHDKVFAFLKEWAPKKK